MYTDPSGEYIFSILAGIFCPPLLPYAMMVDGALMGGAQANGTMNPFKWDYSSGKTWLNMGLGALSGLANYGLSTISPLNFVMGDFKFGVSPNIMLSTNGVGLGVTGNANYSVTSWLRLGADVGLNYQFITTGTNENHHLLFTFGYGLEGGSEKYNGSYYRTHFWATDGTSQVTGGIGLNIGKFNARIENDLVGLGDGYDRYRTAAIQAGWGEYNLRLNMMTGPGADPNKVENGYYASGGVDNIRLGALSFGHNKYGRIGLNSEGIRDLFQNRLIHNNMGIPGFKPLNNHWYFYSRFGTTSRYHLW
jgi:hypothetical protein